MAERSPTVRFQPCETWEAGTDPASGTCAACGWFEEDHWLADLERRPVAAARA